MVKLLHLGLGPLGQKIVRDAHDCGMHNVAAVDPDPGKAGQNLGQLCGIAPMGIRVDQRLEDAIRSLAPGGQPVALVTTISSFAGLEPDLQTLARAGNPVISTCEEPVFPWKTQPEISRRVNSIFEEHGVA